MFTQIEVLQRKKYVIFLCIIMDGMVSPCCMKMTSCLRAQYFHFQNIEMVYEHYVHSKYEKKIP